LVPFRRWTFSARIVTLELAETFVSRAAARDSEDVVVVEVRHSGVSGFGEAQPIDRYEESAESAQAYVRGARGAARRRFRSRSRRLLERLPAREFAARAALDAALHDLQGKLLGQPVWRLLGLRRAGPPTSWTIWLGDPDDMARRAEKALTRFSASQAEARRPRQPRRRARPRGARRRRRPCRCRWT